jgi:hypothetical protein
MFYVGEFSGRNRKIYTGIGHCNFPSAYPLHQLGSSYAQVSLDE